MGGNGQQLWFGLQPGATIPHHPEKRGVFSGLGR